MEKRPIALFITVVLILAVIGLILNKHKDTSISQPVPVHALKFYEENNFNDAVNRVKAENMHGTVKISGGITPHDPAAGFLIAGFYNRLSRQTPETVIIIGPNHYEKGGFKVLTSLYGWQTPFGVVQPDERVINGLAGKNLVKVDETVLPDDHAVAGSMPFIKYYLPDVKVVPLLLSGSMDQKDSAALADGLTDLMNENTVIVAAVDFSHYLTNMEAREKDKTTLDVMRNFNYRKLYQMNNDYVDSPASIGTLLMVMQNLGATHFDLLYNSNSGEIQKNNYIPVTSYFSVGFNK